MGKLNGVEDVFFLSLSPFLHYAFTKPLSYLGRWYIGAGGSYNFIYIEEARYYDHNRSIISNTASIFAFNIKAGFFFNFGIEISYTLRTDFSAASNTLLIGYRHRFIKE